MTVEERIEMMMEETRKRWYGDSSAFHEEDYADFPAEEVERMRREMHEQYAPTTDLIDDAPEVRGDADE